MRRNRRSSKPIAVRTWTERVAPDCRATCALARETWRGGVYEASSFLLWNPRMHRGSHHQQAEDKLLAEVEAGAHAPRLAWVEVGCRFFHNQHRGLALVGVVRDDDRS